MWRAYVDESESNPRLDPGTYILAATLVDDEHADAVREAMAALRPRDAAKLHWYDLSDRTPPAVIKTIAELPALHVVVVRRGLLVERTERRRRKCLVRLARELEARGVHHIVTEAREPKANVRELDQLKRLRSGRLLSREVRLFHIRGPEEPTLWAADAVAGAIVAARTGEPRYLDLLADVLDIVTEP